MNLPVTTKQTFIYLVQDIKKIVTKNPILSGHVNKFINVDGAGNISYSDEKATISICCRPNLELSIKVFIFFTPQGKTSIVSYSPNFNTYTFSRIYYIMRELWAAYKEDIKKFDGWISSYSSLKNQ